MEDGLPLKLVSGFIGECRVQIPWTQLQSGHIKASIDNVHLVFKPVVETGSEYIQLRNDFLYKAKMVPF
jgi:hypothetical protein